MAEVSERDMPLFVRVEGYKDVLEDLEAIRQILENMDESVQVLRKVQKVKEKSIETFLENVDRLDEKLNSVNLELPELEGMRDDSEIKVENRQQVERKPEPRERQPRRDERKSEQGPERRREQGAGRVPEQRVEREPDEEVVESSINDLHSELKGLKDQLDEL